METEQFVAVLRDKGGSQRERLATVRNDWLVALSGLDDMELNECLRQLRKLIKSPKLVAERDQLIGQLRRDGLDGGAPISKPPSPTAETSENHPKLGAVAMAIGGPHPRFNRELDALIAADPLARSARLVYRDWLEEQGIVSAGTVDLWPRPEEQKTKRPAESIDCNCDDLVSELEWHVGFVRRFRLVFTMKRFNASGGPSFDDALGWLLDDPGAARFVEHIVLGLAVHDSNDYSGACAIIGRRLRPALTSLFIGDFGYEECELNWSSIRNASPLWPALPRLRKLTLRAGSMGLGAIKLPQLRSFETISGGLDDDAASSIANAEWPLLESMSVQFGPRHSGGATDPSRLAPLLTGTHLGALTHLGLTNCEFTDELCDRLASAAIVKQLESLDLSMGTMGADGARVLIANRSAFAHLRSIDLDDNFVPGDVTAELVRALPNVVVGSQREDGGDPSARYASAYE